MATVTMLGTGILNTTNGTKNVTATPAVGDCIVIFVAHTGGTPGNYNATSPTDNNQGGGRYSRINVCLKATNADGMTAWIRNDPIGAASSTTFSHAPGTTTGGGLTIFKITGMNRFGGKAIIQSAIQSNQSAGGTPTVTLGTAATTTNPLIGAVFNATSPATMTPRASPTWTEANDLGYSTPTSGIEHMYISSGETGSSIAWGGTSASAFCSMVVELDASSAPVEKRLAALGVG